MFSKKLLLGVAFLNFTSALLHAVGVLDISVVGTVLDEIIIGIAFAVIAGTQR